jgi:hypothetical protein
MHRMPPHVTVKIADIDLPECEPDPIFSDLSLKSFRGECSIASTRVSISRITPGFLRYDSEKNIQHIQDAINGEYVLRIVACIRGGERPVLVIYKNRLPSQVEFLCPDDIHIYEAYRLVGIKKVPVIILDLQESDLEEAAIYSSYCETPDGYISYIHRVSKPNFDSVEAFLGSSPPESFDTAANILVDQIMPVIERLRLFHLDGIVDLHYHHTLSSVLYRLSQTIRGMQILINKELYYQALILLRAMYELALNFYIDWIAPEIVGPLLQLSAVTSKREWLEERRAYYEEKRVDGWDDLTIRILQGADNRAYDLVSKVSEKARVNPLSEKHAGLYSHLSRIAHQDFTMTARYAHTLQDALDSRDDKSLLRSIIVLTDVLTAQVVERVVADTGDLE